RDQLPALRPPRDAAVSPAGSHRHQGRPRPLQLDEERERPLPVQVPTLRNVALTAPYFHDGSATNLHDAIVTMARVQLGTTLSKDDVDLLSRFLGTLTGEAPRAAAGPAARPGRRHQGRPASRR